LTFGIGDRQQAGVRREDGAEEPDFAETEAKSTQQAEKGDRQGVPVAGTVEDERDDQGPGGAGCGDRGPPARQQSEHRHQCVRRRGELARSAGWLTV
jgi:hypothetical protein